MARKDRRGQDGLPVDPFGFHDPAWERYEGVSGLRRWRPRWSRWRERRSGEFTSFMVIGGLVVLILGALLGLMYWLRG